ncbi:MAG TPA: hypothetical protein EYG79_02220 [Rhodobacteraceae bacterium]|nr:hypothetical protein [Paracoccaceae bacterium]
MRVVKIGGKPLQLKDDESIIWQGKPAQGIIRNPVHILWGIVFMALGFWLIFGTVDTLLGVLSLLAGCHLAFFHAIVEKNRRARTYYILTNQRAILAYSLRVLAYPIKSESRFTLRKGRFDTVLFGVDQQNSTPRNSGLRGFGFGHLENGDDVYNLMVNLQDRRPET